MLSFWPQIMPANPESIKRHTPTRTIVKIVRAEAHREGTTFSEAYNRLGLMRPISYEGNRISQYKRQTLCSGANAKNWRNGALYRPQVHFQEMRDAIGEDEVDEELDDHVEEDYDVPRSQAPTISLLDIARPAKKKGVEKEFEVLRSVRQVIVLEEDDAEFEYWEEDWGWEDDWDEIYHDDERAQPRSYAEVLRDTDR